MKRLTGEGLAARTVVATVPPTVGYRLTPTGESLQVPLPGPADWVVAHGRRS